jgi:glycosyltransferase involved in cell wall biosynthesis
MTPDGRDRPGILLVGNYPPPYGGVPKHLEGLVPFLVRCGWDVHVLSGGMSGTYRGPGFTVYKDARPTVPRRAGTVAFVGRSIVSRRRSPVLGALDRLPAGTWFRTMTRASLAADIVRRHDIRVIVAYNLLLGAPPAVVVAEMFDLPLVVTNFGEIYSHRREIDRQLAMVHHIVRRATVLTTLTRHCADSYRELGLDPPVRVLSYGIDHDRFADAAGSVEARKGLGIPAEADVVLYLARLVRDMGLHVLLEALPRLLAERPSTHVLIAGGAGELSEAAEAAARRWPGRVTVVQNVPEGELPSLYAAATVFVAPTIGARACGSLASAEAMAAGKPVVASAVGGIPEVVADGETGVLVPPGRADALADATLAMLGDRERLADLGRRGRERVVREFDNERTNAALEALFREVAGRR